MSEFAIILWFSLYACSCVCTFEWACVLLCHTLVTNHRLFTLNSHSSILAAVTITIKHCHHSGNLFALLPSFKNGFFPKLPTALHFVRNLVLSISSSPPSFAWSKLMIDYPGHIYKQLIPWTDRDLVQVHPLLGQPIKLTIAFSYIWLHPLPILSLISFFLGV